MKILIEDVRTFAGRHEIPIRPLTILTGENSSGKSTFLAALSAISDRVRFPLEPPFNQAPYNLGGYDTIATRFGKADSFSLGWISEESDDFPDSEMATFRPSGGGVSLAEYQLTSNDARLEFHNSESGMEQQVKFAYTNAPDDSIQFSLMRPLKPGFAYGFRQQIYFQATSTDRESTLHHRDLWDDIMRPTIKETISVAPIRTKPERTYDRTLETSAPDGSHIPFTIARILSEKSSIQRRKLVSLLTRFGDESGLFKQIDVRALGKRPSDPFQLQANVSGRLTNLTDVGYGVSQSLPVVIESVLASKGKRLLIQQPEVHLHPRAQAALGSFFVSMVEHDEKEFVIETHSDYILDRIRQDVAKGRLRHSSVMILYFSRRGARTKVHPLELDLNGNIIGAPRSYRQFFAREEMNLLLRTSK